MKINSTAINLKENQPNHLLEKVFSGMKLIPSGYFTMGCDQGGEFEKPAHQVFIDEYWIDETLVSNKEFSQFINETGYITSAEQKGKAWGYKNGQYSDITGLCWRNYATFERENHPVVLVSWHDAQAYAQWIGKRLPTEAEWERAARGGFECKDFPWGDKKPTDMICGFRQKEPDEIPSTFEITSYKPNGYGLFGMVGNVWQWCEDWYGDDYYTKSSEKNPHGPDVGICRVRRGASWNVIQDFRLRCANRGAVEPSTAVPNMGFRCAMFKTKQT